MDSRETVAALEGKFWLELREPRCVPVRKGPWPAPTLAKILREFMAARPLAYITVVTISHAGPDFEDGAVALQMADGRSMSTGTAHIQRTREAHAALRTAGTGRAEAEEMRERCAAWHETQAAEITRLTQEQTHPASSTRAFNMAVAQDHREHAAAIRALPTQTAGGARGE